MKTGIYTPTFYLANKELEIKINGKTTIGRGKGTIIIEDDHMLSELHCEINAKVLDVFIKDLNSKNGVFINNHKIFPHTDIKLNPGDLVKIGSSEYKFFEDVDAMRKEFPPADRRKHPRPKNLYGPENIFSFYVAPYWVRGIYALMILASMGSVFANLQLGVALPKNLLFLEKMYAEQVVFSGVKVVALVWLISFIHSFSWTVYFNRNPLRKGVSFVAYFLVLFLLVDFKNGPLFEIKKYASIRTSVENAKQDETGIVLLKNLVSQNEELKNAYKFTREKLYDDDKKILDDDYKVMMAKIQKQKKKVAKKLD